ncbi:MAG: lytic murein transglycosylase [Pseudomonadota bacterium]
MMRLALLLVALTLPAQAQDHAAVERQYQAWLQQEIWPEARRAGVSSAVFQQAFAGVKLNWKLPDLVPPGSKTSTPRKQSQAEFGSPGRYFRAVRNDAAGATSLRRKHAKTLARIEKQTGVPGHILLGIWGRESGYGRAKIPHNAFEVLGTKAFMSRRTALFRPELIAALKLAQSGQAPSPLKSSWAGALGQPQFLPTNYFKYAADGDGDGRVDIWDSEPDTLASIGRYLADHGWQRGRDWGFEVNLPANVSCALEGPDQGRRISQWEKLGITRVSGRAFPAHERRGEGYLMLPAGRFGPAFIVTPNFYVLKDYNKSDLYALYVGHMGDRIAFGSSGFARGWADIGTLNRSDIAKMQRALERDGHDVGGVDGLPGFKTRRSIGRWQEANGQSATCFPNASLKATLR